MLFERLNDFLFNYMQLSKNKENANVTNKK